jgi:hypothetical protein
MLTKLLSVPKKVWFYVVAAIVGLISLLKLSSSLIANNAKELNLKALIEDAVNSFKLKDNKKKIKELKKEIDIETLEIDPVKIEEFYKRRK